MSAGLPPPILVAGHQPEMANYDSDDLLPPWKLVAQKIVELIISLTIPIGFIAIAHHLLPRSWNALVLPFISLGIIFASVYMFASRRITVQTAPVPLVTPPIVGLRNEGDDCALNSLAQVMRQDRAMMDWFLGVPAPIKKIGTAAFWPPEIFFSPEELASYPNYSFVPLASMPRDQGGQTICDMISFFRQHNITNQQLAQWIMPTEVPIVDPNWFAHLPFEQQVQARTQMEQTISAIKQDPPIFERFNDSLCFFLALQGIPSEERRNILRYFTAIHYSENPQRFALSLIDIHYFFSKMESREKRATDTLLSSREIRPAFVRLNANLYDSNDRQPDVYEALTAVGSLLPEDLKVVQEITYRYQTEGLSELSPGVSAIRTSQVHDHPFIELPITGQKPTLAELWQTFREDRQVPDAERGEGYKLNGPDGADYPRCHEKHQLMTGPPSLWIYFKRYSWSSPSALQPIKIDTPIVLPDIFPIKTIQKGTVEYKLDAFIVHIEHAADLGHYISYKLIDGAAGKKTWYEINDARVREIQGEELARKKEQAYLSHYSRI